MSILTGMEIIREVRTGNVVADPFDESRVGPNSLDVTLAPELKVYTAPLLDMRADNPTGTLVIPPEGLILYPNQLYLASTVERVGSAKYVTYLDGRSSTGRIGISIHQTAGRGDLGWAGRWCLEITVVRPVRVYAGARIGQATFHTVQGDPSRQYRGRYSGGIESSRIWQDFVPDATPSRLPELR